VPGEQPNDIFCNFARLKGMKVIYKPGFQEFTKDLR
jgi:hypothetical protein